MNNNFFCPSFSSHSVLTKIHVPSVQMRILLAIIIVVEWQIGRNLNEIPPHIRQINDTWATHEHAQCVKVKFELFFFFFPSSFPTTSRAWMHVWCMRVYRCIYCDAVRCAYISIWCLHNSHKHLRSTIKSYRTNWKMLAHKLVLLLHRELMTVFGMYAPRIAVCRATLTNDPVKYQSACANP